MNIPKMFQVRRRRLYVAAGSIVGVLIAYMLFCIGDVLAGRPAPDPSKLSLTISANKTTYSVGELPKIRATLTNNTGKTILIAKPLDGSDRGRFPQFMFAITPPANTSAPPQFGMCGNTNPIDTSCFVSVANGRSIDLLANGTPFSLQYEVQRGAGNYVVQATYSTMSDDMDMWLGGPLTGKDAALRKIDIWPQFSRVSKMALTSNVLTLNFGSKWKTPEDTLRNGSVAELLSALNQIGSGPIPPDLSDAMASGIDRACAMDDRDAGSFVQQALARMAVDSDEAGLESVWRRIERERSGERGQSSVSSGENAKHIMQLAVRFSGPNREERLRYLLEWREVNRIGKRTLSLSREVLLPLLATQGEDIDRILLDLYNDAIQNGRMPWGPFELIRDEVVNRKLVAYELASIAAPRGLTPPRSQ
jgi:hypothetical protein